MLPFSRFPLSRLVPSWWMAPWFLLLLGFCSSLFPEFEIRSSCGIQWPIHEGGLCTGGIIQLNLPPLKPPAKATQFLSGLPYLSQPELNKVRRWQTIHFTGNGVTDFINLDATRQYLQILGSDSCRETGVRLKFGSQASYACFMEVLYTLRIWSDHKTYWVDVRHIPLTLYVVNSPPEPLSSY